MYMQNSKGDVSIEINLSLQHLQAELARIDLLIQRAVRSWQLAHQDPADAFRGLYVSDEQASALLMRPFGSNWGHTAPIETTEAQVFTDTLAQADLQARALAEAARCQGHTPRLERLATVFDLNRFETDVLLICLAPALDLRYERLYGYLQDDVTRKRPSINLALDLLCDGDPSRLLKLTHFTRDAPLFKHHLLERVTESGSGRVPTLCQTLIVDESIVTWLLGSYQPLLELGAHSTLVCPEFNPTDELLAGHILGQLDKATLERSIIVFYGPDQTAQKAASRLLAANEKRSLLTVDLAPLIGEGTSPMRALRMGLRDARLTGALLCLNGWDTCLVDDAPPPDLLDELCAFPDFAVVTGRLPWRAVGVEREQELRWLEFPIPAYRQRRALWKHFLGHSPLLREEAELDLTALAGQFQLTSGQIRDAVATARDRTAQHSELPISIILFASARAHSNPRLSRLARKIMPRYGWEDIVLPDDQLDLLREIIATVRGRPQVLDEWGVGQKLVSSRGVTSLFAGPPGTGKTMAAEIIAEELGLDLYKIDLSTIVSKYIGETEKNLERIFREATTSNAILFFDEADALFGKRSEVRDSHDRYANIEISYLLQRMEAYDGITILATNLRANLDEAFTRRLQFSVGFPFPEEQDRLRIWQTLFPPDVPREANLDFDILARRFKLAGGNIRNILVSAAFLAAADGKQVTMSHLLHGTRRELQKMGRLIGEEDLVIG